MIRFSDDIRVTLNPKKYDSNLKLTLKFNYGFQRTFRVGKVTKVSRRYIESYLRSGHLIEVKEAA